KNAVMQRTVTVSVIGVSGREAVKGSKGVGKSLICNRFVRGDFDDFFPEHCSVLSQVCHLASTSSSDIDITMYLTRLNLFDELAIS
ncbi:hypothetical protein NECAME_19226, partial [Necator americanus]